MKNTILITYPGNEVLADRLAEHLDIEKGEVAIRSFPDGESLVRIDSEVKDKVVLLVCSLDQPNEKLLPLYFLARTAKELGAQSICLISPYLAYMRQDKAFHIGEGVSANYFAELISESFDALVTVDPHLHRFNSLSEIYSIPTNIIESAADIAKWITAHVANPLLIGPDSESHQWVSEVARMAKVPFVVLSKTRQGDHQVEVELPDMASYKERTPVLVDDIISTATTMTVAVSKLLEKGLRLPVCIGIHAVFSGDSYQRLLDSGAAQVVTCDTIPHLSNAIDLSLTLAKGVEELFKPIG